MARDGNVKAKNFSKRHQLNKK